MTCWRKQNVSRISEIVHSKTQGRHVRMCAIRKARSNSGTVNVNVNKLVSAFPCSSLIRFSCSEIWKVYQSFRFCSSNNETCPRATSSPRSAILCRFSRIWRACCVSVIFDSVIAAEDGECRVLRLSCWTFSEDLLSVMQSSSSKTRS